LLTSGNSSRLVKSLVMDTTIASQVYTFMSEDFDPGLFNVYAIAGDSISANDLEKSILEQIDSVIKNGVTANELQKVKNQKLMEFYRSMETINGKANSMGTYEVFFGDFKKMYDAPKLYEKVTIEDIKRVAAKYFTERNRTVGYLLPEKKA